MVDIKKNRKNGQKASANPRKFAADSLVKWEKLGKYAGLEAAATLEGGELHGADRGLYSALVYGVVERSVTLDYIIDRLSSTPAKKLEPIVRAALRLGLYQLLYMDKIPDHAAVSESVALVPKRASGLVNGVLRAFLRGEKNFELPPRGDDLAGHLSVKYSVPRELCVFFLDAYGEADTEGILDSSFGGDRLCLRVNTLKCSPEAAASRLSELGAESRLSKIVPHVLVTSGNEFLSGIDEGLWFVQDEASAAAVAVLSPEKGSVVLDMCAAPGGKSFGCAITMENEGSVRSFDIHENKLSLIRDGAKRLGIEIIEADVGDGKSPAEELFGCADYVLCDAPCSGLGVLSKKPDIRYKSVADIAGLPGVQYDILCSAAKCVKQGGVLMYSTCTLNPAENEGVFMRFRDEHPEFEPMPFELCGMGNDGYATLMPHKTGTDGFFISKFIRVR
ncbi:MAG: 16S rRNA (cytosine(967)-C(5))-methyltransferase RsmB [Ruminococcaceae bacterium]|nr:16S rRNA (cytosine(967)-C(5))-methyltransferase RsmB [Oscillospiraceae bacterium]